MKTTTIICPNCGHVEEYTDHSTEAGKMMEVIECPGPGFVGVGVETNQPVTNDKRLSPEKKIEEIFYLLDHELLTERDAKYQVMDVIYILMGAGNPPQPVTDGHASQPSGKSGRLGDGNDLLKRAYKYAEDRKEKNLPTCVLMSDFARLIAEEREREAFESGSDTI